MKINNYTEIEGWFDFEDIYQDAVSSFGEGSKFVEIGSWLGKSTAYMADLIKDKNINFYAVDSWSEDFFKTDEPLYKEYLKLEKTPKEIFLKNLKDLNLQNFVNILEGDSKSISERFENNTLDFVFIDGDHSYEGCLSDLNSWLDKVKNGGWIAGHDYGFNTVNRALDSFFGKTKYQVEKYNNGTSNSTWRVIK